MAAALAVAGYSRLSGGAGAIAAWSTDQPGRGRSSAGGCRRAPALGPGPIPDSPRVPAAGIRGAPGLFPMRWPGSRSHARAMNTTTVNPGAPAAGSSGLHSRTESRYQAEPERAALRRPVRGRMLTGVAAGLAGYLGVDVTNVRIAFVVLTIAGGAGMPLYLAGLLLIPEQGSGRSIAGAFIESRQSRSR